MAKPLNTKPPTSSVASMLQPGIGAAALGKPVVVSIGERLPLRPVSEMNPPKPVPLGVTPEPTDKLVQFSLTASAIGTLDHLITIYEKPVNLKLKRSEMLRAILKALRHAMPELQREAIHIGSLKRPKNDPGNEALREQMEQSIANAIVAGMRASDLPVEQPPIAENK